MVYRYPQTPLLQIDGERGFVFCGSGGKTKKMIAAKLNSQQRQVCAGGP